jgi:catalase
MGAGKDLVESAGVPATLPSGKPDPGLIRLENGQLDDGIAQFIAAIAKHRHFARETDPPAV